jgi:folate-dependent phosphoribosylglycinamide formyltransferase PurN
MTVPDGSSDSPRVAVLCAEYIPRWERNALETMIAETDAEITTVVALDAEEQERGRSAFVQGALERVRRYPLWSVVGFARLLSSTPERDQFVPVDAIDAIAEAEWVYCTPAPADGVGETIPEDVVEHVEADADVAVRFHGFGILKGDILRAPTHGILSFHVGDIREYRGVMGGGFWEFLHGKDEMGVTLQQLTETIDGGRIVAFERLDISEFQTWQEIQQHAFSTTEEMLARGVQNVSDPAFSPREPDELGDVYYPPQGRAVLEYLVKNTTGRLRNYLWEPTPPRQHTSRRGAD